MTMTQDKIIDRDSLQEAYVKSILDGMDWKTMEQFVYDSLNNNLDDYTVEELITEVEDYYPELLEQTDD
jgi:alcohol dehydrogenase class IV